MAKAAFRVEDGIIPGHVNNDLGHTSSKFRHVHVSGTVNAEDVDVADDIDIGGNVSITGNLSATGPTINLPNFDGGGGGGGGGITAATSIAFAVALG